MIYSINEGQSRWWPFIFRWYRDFKKAIWYVIPDKSMQFNYQYNNGVVDEDWRDWKKIGGLSFADWRNLINLFRKDKDSVILAWRWNVEIKKHEFAIYENRNNHNIPYESPSQILRIDADEKAVLEIHKSGNDFKCYLFENEQTYLDVNPIVITPRFKATMFSYINLWYGGKNNSKGPYGGSAPQNMRCDVGYLLEN